MLILLVDDDLEDREIFCEAIEEIDPSIKCLIAKDGNEAIQLLTRDYVVLPDYIFLDINMPLMNGKECLQIIKGDPKLKDIPVIIYSTTAPALQAAEYLRIGAEEILVKPATYSELLEALHPIVKV